MLPPSPAAQRASAFSALLRPSRCEAVLSGARASPSAHGGPVETNMADAGNSGRDTNAKVGGKRLIAKLLQSFGYQHDRHRVFSDCMEMMAIAISNAIDKARFEERERQYVAIAGRYTKDEMGVFTQILAELVLALEASHDDVMGAVFGELELGNAAAGQFFTPFEISRLMARLTLGDGAHARSLFEQYGFVSVMEPAVGAGGMVIAMAEALRDAGINYQRQMHVTAVDVDARAAHMAYVQLSLLHVPAIVIVGNSLSLEQRERWYTPAHVIGGWSWRLRRRRPSADELESADRGAASTPDPAPGQMRLF